MYTRKIMVYINYPPMIVDSVDKVDYTKGTVIKPFPQIFLS